jgi:Pvc16 N-terminal domain
MTNNAIAAATTKLRFALEGALTSAGVTSADVFLGPLDDPHANSAQLILFPYKINATPTLRNQEHCITRPGTSPKRICYDNAIPLDVHLLLTVGKNLGLTEELGLRYLGIAMQHLNSPTIAGQLQTLDDLMFISLETMNTDELARVWNFFPTVNFRTSVSYILTPVWIDPIDDPIVANRVVNDTLQSGQRAGLN